VIDPEQIYLLRFVTDSWKDLMVAGADIQNKRLVKNCDLARTNLRSSKPLIVTSSMDNSRENLKSFDTSYSPYDTWLKQGNFTGRYVARNKIVKKNC